MEDSRPGRYGLDASPTQVERIFLPEAKASRPPLTGTGRQLAEHIREAIVPYLPKAAKEEKEVSP